MCARTGLVLVPSAGESAQSRDAAAVGLLVAEFLRAVDEEWAELGLMVPRAPAAELRWPTQVRSGQHGTTVRIHTSGRTPQPARDAR